MSAFLDDGRGPRLPERGDGGGKRGRQFLPGRRKLLFGLIAPGGLALLTLATAVLRGPPAKPVPPGPRRRADRAHIKRD
jgi:hypothetical protein